MLPYSFVLQTAGTFLQSLTHPRQRGCNVPMSIAICHALARDWLSHYGKHEINISDLVRILTDLPDSNTSRLNLVREFLKTSPIPPIESPNIIRDQAPVHTRHNLTRRIFVFKLIL